MVVRIIEGCNPVTVPPAAAVQDMGNVFCKLAVDTEQAVNLRMAVEEPCQKRFFFSRVRDGQRNQALMLRRKKTAALLQSRRSLVTVLWLSGDRKAGCAIP